MTIKNDFPNDSVSAVIQCLFNIPYFTKFIVMKTYQKSIGPRYSQKKEVCDALNALFTSFFNDLRLNNRLKNDKVNLKYLIPIL